jgi:hypothetical protein
MAPPFSGVRHAKTLSAAAGVVGRTSLPFLIIYRDFGLLRSDYTILIIAAVEAIINKLRMNTGFFRLLWSLSKDN